MLVGRRVCYWIVIKCVEISMKQWNTFRKPSIYTRVSLKTVLKKICGSGRKKRGSTAESQCLGELVLEKPSPTVEYIFIGKRLFVPILYEVLMMGV